MTTSLFEMLPTNYLFTNHMDLIYICKYVLALKNLQGLICLKTQPNKDGFGIK